MHTTIAHSYIKILYVFGVVFCLVPGVSPALALGIGIIFGLIGINPWPHYGAQGSRILLQSAVVGLGFGLPLQQVWEVGRASFGTTLAGILLTLGLGIFSDACCISLSAPACSWRVEPPSVAAAPSPPLHPRYRPKTTNPPLPSPRCLPSTP